LPQHASRNNNIGYFLPDSAGEWADVRWIPKIPVYRLFESRACFSDPQNGYDPRVDFRDYAVQLATNRDPKSVKKLALLAYKAGQIFTDPISGLVNGLTENADVFQSSSDPNNRVGVFAKILTLPTDLVLVDFCLNFRIIVGDRRTKSDILSVGGGGAWLPPPAARRDSVESGRNQDQSS
jgi:hypothetical protein